MQISRLFNIVYMLLAKKTTTAKELADYFEVSTRTIYRDIDALSSAGIPIYASQGKGGGISLLDDFVLNKSLLSEQEQNEILIGLQSLTVTEYPDIDHILSKLGHLFKKNHSNWIEADFSPWGSKKMSKEKFNTLKSAILNSKIISFDYFNSSGVKSSRRIEPIKLIFKDKSWYLQGFCLFKNQYRNFKINRIINMHLIDEPFTPRMPDELPMDAEEHQFGRMVDVKLKISSLGAFRVYDEFDEEDVVKVDDGSFLVTTVLPEGDWLYNYILSFGTVIEGIEPQSIREIIGSRLEIMMQNIMQPL